MFPIFTLNKSNSKHIKGASLTEFVIITPIAILFVLASVQAGLIYMAKSTLNNAVFMAARHGANNNASESAIKDSLAKGLIPFYIDAFNKPDVGSMGMAYGKAKVALANPLNFNKVEIISPSTAMYDVYGINSPTGRYIPNDNLEYRDASPRASADGQISIRDANILKIKVTYAYDIDKIPLMATLFRRVMCTGFLDQGSIVAWSAKGAAYDASNCKYYLNKKLPIVVYATVQMQSNAIQVAGGAAPTSPTSPVTPSPSTPTAPSTPTTPLQPYPEPSPGAPVSPTPTTPTTPNAPDEPIACEAQAAPANTQVLMGPMTQQQTIVWQQAIQQKQLQSAQQIKPQSTVILPGPIPLPIPAPITTGPKPTPIDPTDPRGPTYIPNPTLPVISIPPIIGLPITAIINICIPRVSKYPPGKEEECKQLDKEFQAAKTAARGMSCDPKFNDSIQVLQDKYNKNIAEATARDKYNQTCFNGGDSGHNEQADNKRRAAAKCLDLMKLGGK